MRAAGYYRPATTDARSERASMAAIDRYCRDGSHTLARVFGPGDPPSREPDQYAGLVSYLVGLGRGEALVVVPGPRHLADTLDGLVERLIDLQRAGGEVRCADLDLPDPLQNALETLPFAGRQIGLNRRVKNSLLSKAARGEVLGRTPFGYVAGVDGTYRIEPREASTVRRVFELYAGEPPPEGEVPDGGPGLRRIARALNADGLRTRTGRPWSPVTLSGMLRNRAYTGSYARYGMRIAANHDRIIPRDLFMRAQSVTAARRPRRQQRVQKPYLLSGLARCWLCGRGMHGLERKRSWARADGSAVERTYRYYICPSRSVRGAISSNGDADEHPGWRESELDRAAIESVLGADAGVLRASFRPADDETEDAELRFAEQRFLDAVREVAAGHGGVADLAGPLDGLRTARLTARSRQNVPGFDAVVRALTGDDAAAVHEAIESLVDRIVVDPVHVEPVFRPAPA